MPLYEQCYDCRVRTLVQHAAKVFRKFWQVLADNEASSSTAKYWGVKPMAYKINNNARALCSCVFGRHLRLAVQKWNALMLCMNDVKCAIVTISLMSKQRAAIGPRCKT